MISSLKSAHTSQTSLLSQTSVTSSHAAAQTFFDPSVAERARLQLAAVDQIEASTLGSPDERLRAMIRDPVVTSLRRSLAALRLAHAGESYVLKRGAVRLGEGGFFLGDKSIETMDGAAFVFHATTVRKMIVAAAGQVDSGAVPGKGPRCMGPLPQRKSGTTSIFDDDVMERAHSEESALILAAPGRRARLLGERRRAKSENARQKKAAAKTEAVLARARKKAPRVCDVLRERYEHDPYVKTLQAALAQLSDKSFVPAGPRGLVLTKAYSAYVSDEQPAEKDGDRGMRTYLYRDIHGLGVTSDKTEEFFRDVDIALAALAGGVEEARRVATYGSRGDAFERFFSRRRVPASWPRPQFNETLLAKAQSECDRLTAANIKLPPFERLHASFVAQEKQSSVQTYMAALRKLREKDEMFHAVNLLGGIALTEVGIRLLGSDGRWSPLALNKQLNDASVDSWEQQMRSVLANLDIANDAVVVRGPVGRLANAFPRRFA